MRSLFSGKATMAFIFCNAVTAMLFCAASQAATLKKVVAVSRFENKTDYRGQTLTIFIGPRAQDVLRPFMDRPADVYLFSPREARLQRLAARRAARKTPVQPSQMDRSKPRRKRPGISRPPVCQRQPWRQTRARGSMLGRA